MLDNPDQYLLKSGRLIRKLSIDELPQLWNIFVGNMSIIGPRPALWNQDFLTAERDKYGANDIKPGLTGLAQAHGRDELEIPDKAKLDGEYAAALKKSSWSGLKMDIKVFVDSVKAVLKSDGVVEGGTGEIHKQEDATDFIDTFFNGNQTALDSVRDKRILFFLPAFFNYENISLYLHITGLTVCRDDKPLFKQLWTLPFPGEAHSADDRQCSG